MRLHVAKVLPGMGVDLGRCQLLFNCQQYLGEGNGATEVGPSQQQFGFFSAVNNISAVRKTGKGHLSIFLSIQQMVNCEKLYFGKVS